MKVTLISHTPDAAELLIFTKSTRLNLTSGLLDEIKAWHPAKKEKELAYMAETIPSSWEFVDYVFSIEAVSRAYTHQQVRTRAGSYAQQTMRVLNMSDFDYVMSERIVKTPTAKWLVNCALGTIREVYAQLIKAGVPPEDARGILPTNIATNIVCKFNLRTMAELAASRTGGRTQGEYQTVVRAMCDAVIAIHPWAALFLFQKGRDYFAELEEFAAEEWPDDLLKRGVLLKIVDKMRKERK